jgi:hypothetical protein
MYRPRRDIEITLTEGSASSYGNSLSVSADDPAWVDATFVELNEIVRAIKPQNNLFLRFQWLFQGTAAITLGFAILQLIGLLSADQPSPDPKWLTLIGSHPPLLYLVGVLVIFGIGYFPARMVTDWVTQLWPSVEFDFGPEHLRKRKQLRSRIATAFFALILPFAIEIAKRYGLGWN